MRVLEILENGVHYGWFVGCPACQAADRGSGHLFAPNWAFNGDKEKPTFSPSMLAQSVYGPERVTHVCHSFVRDGRIEYLSDCTHAMAGQTVELPDSDNLFSDT